MSDPSPTKKPNHLTMQSAAPLIPPHDFGHGVCEHCGGSVGDDGMAEAGSEESEIPPDDEDRAVKVSDLFAAAV